MILLRLDNDIYFVYFFLCLGALILWYYLVRGAVRASEVVKNQKAIIYLLKYQFIKQGASTEEIKTMEEDITRILES